MQNPPSDGNAQTEIVGASSDPGCGGVGLFGAEARSNNLPAKAIELEEYDLGKRQAAVGSLRLGSRGGGGGEEDSERTGLNRASRRSSCNYGYTREHRHFFKFTWLPGETNRRIVGPNGSGKSTLSKVLARHPAYGILDGSAIFDGEDLVEMEAVDASRAGIFLAFQYPIELPGVGNSDFLRVMLNEKRKAQGLDELDPLEFLAVATRKCELVKMDPTFLARNVNEGFSGGEKKRNEILQMAMLEPKLAILDETDSGLDIDALRTISDGINSLRRPDNAFIIITHYQRLLDYIKPDFVHVMANGKIVKTGGADLALELERSGYVFN